LMSIALVILLAIFFSRLADDARSENAFGLSRWSWSPFAGAVTLFVLAFLGLAYSLFPYLVLDRITVWSAASAPESLQIILWGAVVVVPTIFLYTVFVYRVFWGKAEALSYQ
jgi:cytochrome d ubiquinol oxidase subunit II